VGEEDFLLGHGKASQAFLLGEKGLHPHEFLLAGEAEAVSLIMLQNWSVASA